MALVKCPHCNSDVSDKAVKCPHCGYSLSKPSIIQHNNIDSKIGKFILAFIILIGGALCIYPLIWLDPFWMLYYLPITYVRVGFGLLAGLLSIGLTVNGIVRLCKHEDSTWKYWLLTLLFSYASAVVGGFLLSQLDWKASYDFRCKKVEAVKGTYECQLQDGSILQFSIISKDDSSVLMDSVCVNCVLKPSVGISKMGYCDVSFYPKDNVYEIECHEIGEKTLTVYANAEMTILYVGNDKFPLKKISDKAMSEEEYKAEAEAEEEAEAQTKLEEFNNFRSKDLSAFMLHGKVKEVFESYGGTAGSSYSFNEDGLLIEATVGDNHVSHKYKIKHEGNKLTLISEDPSWSINTFEINGSGRLIGYYCETNDYAAKTIYSNYDSNGWPTHETTREGEEIVDQVEYEYPEIDEHGNWTKQTYTGGGIAYRSITYYPIE